MIRHETVNIEDLNPAPYNPRIPVTPDSKEYQQIKSSIETYGLVEPIVVNANTMTVIGGHQRLTVLRDMGFTEVDCALVDIEDEEKEKSLNLALNNIKGDWDLQMLEALLTDESVQAYETGFAMDDNEFRELFAAEQEAPAEAVPQETEYSDAEKGSEETNGICYFSSNYRWKISAKKYKDLMTGIRSSGKFSKKEIVDELIWRFVHD